jgi:Flp pilus assembly protein TadD
LAEFRAPGLAMLGDLKNARGLPDEYFQLAAATCVDLPAGRYRFHTRSDDGVRLYVDGRRVIDAWHIRPTTTDAAEVDLAAGPHEVRVEYYQSGGLRSLWVRVEPLAHEALALGMPSLEREVAGLTAATDARPNDQALLRRRADALMRGGRFEEAERDFARLIEFDAKEHWFWYLRACMLAYLRREEDYRSHCRALLKQFPGGETGFTAERVTKSALLLPGGIGGDVPELARRAEELLTQNGENAWNQHLAGLAYYRAGRFEEAIPLLQKTGAPEHPNRSPGRLVSANALLAMAYHRLGRAAEARAAFERCEAIVAGDLVPRGMGNIQSPENWLVAHTLRREAGALLNCTGPATAPTAPRRMP